MAAQISEFCLLVLFEITAQICAMNKPVFDNEDRAAGAAPENAPKRWLMACLGVFFVGVAGVGVVLPGIPTVGPLLLASVFLTKSSPALERRLVRNRFFAKYLQYVDGKEELSPQAKRTSIALMWLSIGVSYSVLHLTGQGRWWLLAILILAGFIGTVFIWRFGRKKN